MVLMILRFLLVGTLSGHGRPGGRGRLWASVVLRQWRRKSNDTGAVQQGQIGSTVIASSAIAVVAIIVRIAIGVNGRRVVAA